MHEHDIGKLQAQDESAWKRLIDEYWRRIYRFAKRHVGDRQTAEDLSQDIFLGAGIGIARVDRELTLDAFLWGIARERVDRFRQHRLKSTPAQGGDAERPPLRILRFTARVPGYVVLGLVMLGMLLTVLTLFAVAV